MDDLPAQVRKLLEARQGDWPRIAAEASVSYSWVSKFFNGKIANPGYTTLKKLHNVLERRKEARAQ